MHTPRVQPGGAFRSDRWVIINLVFGGLCWLALTLSIAVYVTRTTRARRQGKRWYQLLHPSGLPPWLHLPLYEGHQQRELHAGCTYRTIGSPAKSSPESEACCMHA